MDGGDSPAFGFVDPSDVLRGVKLIPAFKYGKTAELLLHSTTRVKEDGNDDWAVFYVGW